MSRRVYLLGVGIALVALAFAMTDWTLRPPFGPGVTEANARRIRPGMTQEAVESLLGGKPKHAISARHMVMNEAGVWEWVEYARNAVWKGPDGEATVYFVPNGGGVRSASFKPNGARPGVLARLRAWLGR